MESLLTRTLERRLRAEQRREHGPEPDISTYHAQHGSGTLASGNRVSIARVGVFTDQASI